MREQFFGDVTLGAAPWPLTEGTRKAQRGDHAIPLGDVLPWFNRASSGIAGRRETLPELFSLVGRRTDGVVVSVDVFLQAPRLGLALASALEEQQIRVVWDDPQMSNRWGPEILSDWAGLFGIPAPLTVPHIRCTDKDNTQVDPDWLQGVLWRTPFQLRRGDLVSFFDAEFNQLHALMLHVARTGEPLTANVD
jgi:hypothetical protein